MQYGVPHGEQHHRSQRDQVGGHGEQEDEVSDHEVTMAAGDATKRHKIATCGVGFGAAPSDRVRVFREAYSQV